MRVREIMVSRPEDGGPDVPLMFELDKVEMAVIGRYLSRGCRLGDVRPELFDWCCGAAERGAPDAITMQAGRELSHLGRESEVSSLVPFLEFAEA